MTVCDGLLVPTFALKSKKGNELLITAESRAAIDSLREAMRAASDKPPMKDWSPCYGAAEQVSKFAK